MNRFFFKEVLRGLLLLAFAPVLVLWWLVERNSLSIELLSFRVVDRGVEIGETVRQIWRAFVGVVKLAGWIAIVLLVAFAVATLSYLVLNEMGYSCPLVEPYYPIAARILENKVAWAAISIILGAMVAISHLKSLEINQTKFEQEQRDRARKEREEAEARQRDRATRNTLVG